MHIQRDTHGVCHVVAEHESDLYLGLGFCHAVDRATQMTLTRVLGQGRACELLRDDPELLKFDRFFRRMNLSSGTEAEEAKLSKHHRLLAEAYCEGVNHGLARGRPLELLLLRLRPEPWTVGDCVLLARVLGYFALAQSQGDMERFIIELVQGGVTGERIRELFPALGDDFDEDLLGRVRLDERLVPERLRWASSLPSAAASNAWAVAGDRSASGAGLLAADPHLEVNRLPALWYEVVLERRDRFCMGATMPGLPAVAVGRTNTVAWGITYGCMDAHDAWVEDCRDRSYRQDVDGVTRWKPFRVRREVIRRRRNPPEEVTFFENEHGVLHGDPSRPGLYLTERWSGSTDTGAATLAAAFDVLEARDAAGALDALARTESSWTFVAADRQGGIGIQMSGLMPRRRPGAGGLAALPGWDPRNDWHGFVAAEDLPGVRNPEGGYVVAANHDLNELGRARPINLPMGPHRAQRIAALLAARDRWTVEGFRRLQMDVVSEQAIAFMEVLRPLLPEGQQADALRDWDCSYGWDSTGAYMFECFYRGVIEEVFGAACGSDVVAFMLDETGVVAGFYDDLDRVLLDPSSAWYGSLQRDEVFARVAARVLRDPAKRWADHQRFTLTHVVFGGRLPRWTGFDVGPVPLRGTRATIHQGQIFGSAGRRVTVAPSYRLVADLEEGAAHTVLPGGSSERRSSRWYASGIGDWLAGGLKRLDVGL